MTASSQCSYIDGPGKEFHGAKILTEETETETGLYNTCGSISNAFRTPVIHNSKFLIHPEYTFIITSVLVWCFIKYGL
jgi:hypothetical protein